MNKQEIIQNLRAISLKLFVDKLYTEASIINNIIQSLTQEVSTNASDEVFDMYGVEIFKSGIKFMSKENFIKAMQTYSQSNAEAKKEDASKCIDGCVCNGWCVGLNETKPTDSTKKARRYTSPILDELDKEIDKDNAEAMREAFKYFFECGRNYQNNAEVTFNESCNHYLNTLTTK